MAAVSGTDATPSRTLAGTDATPSGTFAKADAVALALDTLPGPAVCTTGYTARLGAARGEDRVLPLVGSMGLALPVGIGIAATTGRTTLVLDGDGSLLMNPADLLELGSRPDLPLVHVVLDDGAYASTGAQPVPSQRVDVPALARAAGVTDARRVEGADALRAALLEAAQARRPVVLHCPVTSDSGPPAPRVDTPLPTLARRFTMEAFERGEPRER
ncbi:MAG TPA: hypothetical protein DHV14_11790 [Micrococcales bacterium]|nr:hypothetical protein [Micrococcales bacterium]